MMHEIIVDPRNLHKVFYCIVFDRFAVRSIKTVETEIINKIVILSR